MDGLHIVEAHHYPFQSLKHINPWSLEDLEYGFTRNEELVKEKMMKRILFNFRAKDVG